MIILIEWINQILWAVATTMIILSGLFFTKKLKGIQFRFSSMIYRLFEKEEKKEGITPVQTLMMSLAGRIGVGSIAGVALAIYIGGVGSVFWMWMIALITGANTFVETVLGVKFKEKDEGKIYVGGPSYYLKNGLHKLCLGKIYAILIIMSYTIGFLGIQSNTITRSCQEMFSVSAWWVGTIIVLFSGLIIFGGVKKIADVTSRLVPVMTLVYVATAIYIVIMNIHMIPTIFIEILKQAFRFDAFFSAFLPTLIIGIQRGLFSNEAGIGTGSIVASATDSNDVKKQGYLQVLGIYITTFLICTSTAIIILTSDYTSFTSIDINGIELTQRAFHYHLGNLGTLIVFLSILLFSFSTILTGYYYGESSLKYILREVHSRKLIMLKVITLLFLMLGSILPSNTLWKIVDIFVALLAIINTYAILKLQKVVEKET